MEAMKVTFSAIGSLRGLSGGRQRENSFIFLWGSWGIEISWQVGIRVWNPGERSGFENRSWSQHATASTDSTFPDQRPTTCQFIHPPRWLSHVLSFLLKPLSPPPQTSLLADELTSYFTGKIEVASRGHVPTHPAVPVVSPSFHEKLLWLC